MNSGRPSTYTTPLYDTTPLTAALANPYARQHYVSPHYHQAYLRACSSVQPRTTADGYTLSSTYVPGTAHQANRATSTVSAPLLRQSSAQTLPQPAVRPITNHLTFGSWYQPGNCRCTRQGCPFTGSRKSVEIHMMDRHFVFPPGWEQKDDWDADPSLKGKPIAIHGTSLLLDTPEALDTWIAERKRRFPTEEHIRDKKRKLEEAAARGQLVPEDVGAGARKKRRRDATVAEGGNNGFRGRAHQRGRGRRHRGVVPRPAECVDARTNSPQEERPRSESISDNDEAPEVVSSKAPITPLCIPKNDAMDKSEAQTSHANSRESVKRISLPKKPPRNPFASRSTLLRNLLLPEIRITVSNLSQAIRFLVENDFLRNVELRPGDARDRMIEVLGSSETACSVSPPEGPSGGV